MDFNKRKRVLFSREEINTRVKALGDELSNHYKDKNLLVVSLLRGSFIFAADLIREISVPLEIDFITTASYGNDEISSGTVDIVHDLRSNVEGKDVLIVDDIIDSGYTLERVIEHIKEKNPKSIKVCVMLDKPSRRRVELTPDFNGFIIPDLFIVGYGLNYGEHYRNTPYIFTFD
ncbi:MAG: hypoxanthine phosphoribosyltransferase [Tissierellia bacterium]|nr:hypoxanthine phosphoribosyltransferase [Tissierellia bacterium]